MTSRLPRGVERLFSWTVPADERDPVSGDLLEEYAENAASNPRRRSARALLWWRALQIAASFTWERLRRDRTLPPIGEEPPRRSGIRDVLAQDLTFGARMLRREPGFTAVALVALALGIGANTTIFSIVDAALWRPLPFPRADRIMSLTEQRPRESRWFGPVAPADFFDWRRDSRSFSAMAAIMIPGPSSAYNLTGGGEPERIRPLKVSPAFLGVIGVAPALGRDFTSEEEIDGRERVVLLSDDLWRRRFGADPSIVGRTIAFDGNPFEVIGVLPARFWWPTRPDVVVPLALDDHDRTLRAAHFLEAVGRLRDGVSQERAREELRLIGDRLSRNYPAENANHAPNLRPLRDALVGDVRPALVILFGAVGFVMLIACANVATVLLARAAGRQKELAVRRAVGATRGRVVQQMLTESVLVALIGGAAGLLVAWWGLAVVRAILPARFMAVPGIANASLDGRVLGATLVLSAVTGLVFGILPALVASDAHVGAALGEETRSSTGGVRARTLRSALVVAELALSLVLLAGAGLLLVSFTRLVNVNPGFRAAQLTIASITLPYSRYGGHARTVAFFDALFDRLRSAPGVQHVAATTSLPFDGVDSRLNLTIEHRVEPEEGAVRAHPRIVSTDYFETLGVPVIRGRAFTTHDAESSPNVVIINQAAARRHWPGEDPLGQRISLGSAGDWREIVGIVADTRHEGLDADVEPAAFLPQHQLFSSLGAAFERTVTIVIRSTNDVTATTALLRSAVASVDPDLPIGMVRTMEDVIGDSVAPRRLNFVLVSSFAIVALLLSASGLYGVMAYIVVQRTREIGVRMALGATRRQVLAMMFVQAGRMTALGIGLGVAGALLVTRSMTSLLFGVSAADPLLYVAVSTLLAAVALVAVAVPASRATRIDPLVALR
jgi:putative ABC transport system permease protein